MATKGFQQAIRSATVTYPIPFLVGILLLFALLCLGVAMFAADRTGLVSLIFAAVAVTTAVGVLVYALLARPDLLRSESHVLMMTITDIMGDKEMDPAQRERVSHALLDVLGRKRVKGSDAGATQARNRRKGNSDA